MGRSNIPPAGFGPAAEGSKQCVGKYGCGRWKPLEAFPWNAAKGKYESWCKVCRNLRKSKYQRTPEAKAKRAAYNASPRAKELRSASRAARIDQIRAAARAGAKTPRGRIADQLRKARRRLATAIRRVDELKHLIYLYESELRRITGAPPVPERPANSGRKRK